MLEVDQSYISHTPILKTVFTTKDGVFEVRDYMPRFIASRSDYHCPSEIHRDILRISGNPKIIIELNPRPNYGSSEACYYFKKDYLKIVSQEGEYNSFYLYSNMDHHKIVSGEPIELKDSEFMLLSYHEKLSEVDNDSVYLEYEKTKTYWLDWISRMNLPSKYKHNIIRSMITLKLLMYQKTGAVIAAPTTSLPEIIGKDRNWDYRFCWVRDASMIVDLYVRMGDFRSANRFINFILNRMLLKHENISVMYGINGEKILTEKQLDHLDGYKGSKPVRIGNDAYRQKQNDVYGELIETMYTYFVVNRRGKFSIDEEVWTVVRSLIVEVTQTWKEPDSGIWERREDLKHYVHSKFMSWVAFDRAAKIAKFIGKDDHVEGWRGKADEIKEDILTNGWNEEVGAFTMYYGSDMLDASNLLMMHYGFLSKDDHRMISTVKKSYEVLVKDNFCFRYIDSDEFGAPENAFIVCTFWMINSLYLIGEVEKAREMFDNILTCRNKLGLYAEDVEIKTKRMTGNFPQGYSHLALIQTVLLLETDYNWSDAFKE